MWFKLFAKGNSKLSDAGGISVGWDGEEKPSMEVKSEFVSE